MSTIAHYPKVLVINESPVLLERFQQALEIEFDVEVSMYNYETIETVTRLHPDLILLDFTGEGGLKEWEMLQVLRMDDATENTPILVCVNPHRMYREWETHFHEQGIHLLFKPFRKKDILEQMRQFVHTDSAS
jgi:CheY-like chemotaxis protein